MIETYWEVRAYNAGPGRTNKHGQYRTSAVLAWKRSYGSRWDAMHDAAMLRQRPCEYFMVRVRTVRQERMEL